MYFHKQTGWSDITARYKHAVWRQFLKDMRLTCTFRTQFHEVEVILNMREQTCKSDELFTSVHHLWVQSHGVHQEVYPLVSGEVLTLVNVFLQIHIGDLYGLQCLDVPSYFYVLAADIADGDYTPYTIAAQQFWVGFHVLCTDRHSCQSKIGEGRLIFVILLVESDRHLVDDAVLAALPYFSFYRLRFSTMYIVVLNDLLDLL